VLELITLLQAAFRRWWLFVLLGALGVGVAYVSSVTTPTLYKSTVTLQLNPAANSALLPYGSSSEDANPVAGMAASYAEVIRSRSFSEIVVRELNLPFSADAIAASLDVGLIPKTNILRLTVSWDDPDSAQQLAQKITEIFLARNVQRQGGAASTQTRIEEMERTARSYPARIDALRQQRDRLDQTVARGDLSRLPELNNLDGRLAGLETSYANLLVEISRVRSSMDTASILDRATPAAATSGLPLLRAIPFGLASGLALAAAVTFLLERLDDRVRRPQDVAAVCGNHPIGVIRRIRGRRARQARESSHILTILDYHASLAEQFRLLRANIQSASPAGRCRSLVITSSSHREGKSFIAVNLAVAWAQSGERVLLVDADLRQPSVHHMFGVSNQGGFTHALSSLNGTQHAEDSVTEPEWHGEVRQAGGVSAATTAQRPALGITSSGVDNLSLLVSGPLPANPTAVLKPTIAPRLLEQLGDDWDVVLFDTAPILPVADTRLMVAGVDAVVVVARSGQTTNAALGECLQALGQLGPPVLGVVLNDFEPGLLGRSR